VLFIDTSRLSPSDAWLAKAEEALELMLAASTRAERSEILRLRARLWSRIKRDLESLSGGKCWYCEARQSRSRMAVDHFRPKGRLRDIAPEHEGYWWLAFDISNYRLSCTFCNSAVKDEDDVTKGKQNFFPLVDENARARTPRDDLDRERPILLDPTRAVDPPLLFFDADGRVHPHPRLAPEGTVRFERARATIELLNLNHPGLRDKRKRLNRRLNRELRAAMRYWPGFVKEADPDSALFEESCEALKQAIAEYAQLAATARCYLRGRRTGDGVVEEVLTTVE
jgi:uncharacterized protein (TIGR02646 family)